MYVDSYKQLGPPYRVPSDTRSAHDGARSATYYSAGLRVRLPPAHAAPGASSTPLRCLLHATRLELASDWALAKEGSPDRAAAELPAEQPPKPPKQGIPMREALRSGGALCGPWRRAVASAVIIIIIKATR